MSTASAFIAKLEMPLVVKDLIQASQRRRTYVVRWTYAVAVVSVGLWVFYEFWQVQSDMGLAVALGRGRETFFALMLVQGIALYIFVPVLMAGSVFEERQKRTLSDLLITPMSGWRILVEKYLAGTLPAVLYLLVAGPLAAVLMALGGVSVTELVGGHLMVIWVIVMQGGLTLALSTSQTSHASIVVSAILTPLLVSVLVAVIGAATAFYLSSMVWQVMSVMLCPPWLFFMPAGTLTVGWVEMLVASSVLMTFQAAIFLAIARFWLWRRIEIKERTNAGKSTFNLLRRAGLVARAIFAGTSSSTDKPAQPERKFTGRIVDALVTRQQELPDERPIAWRAARQYGVHRPLGVAIVFCLALLVPLLAMLFWLAYGAPRGQQVHAFSAVLGTAVLVSLVGLTMTASSVFSDEYRRQTIAALSVMPIPSWRIVWQKLAGVRRIALLLAVALALTCVIEAWVEQGLLGGVRVRRGKFYFGPWVYVGLMSLYYPIVLMSGVLLGAALGQRHRGRATGVVATAAAMVWLLGPLIVAALISGADANGPGVVAMVSPVMTSYLMSVAEARVFTSASSAIWHVSVGFAVCFLVLVVSAILLLMRADRLVGREPLSETWGDQP